MEQGGDVEQHNSTEQNFLGVYTLIYFLYLYIYIDTIYKMKHIYICFIHAQTCDRALVHLCVNAATCCGDALGHPWPAETGTWPLGPRPIEDVMLRGPVQDNRHFFSFFQCMTSESTCIVLTMKSILERLLERILSFIMSVALCIDVHMKTHLLRSTSEPPSLPASYKTGDRSWHQSLSLSQSHWCCLSQWGSTLE